LQQVKHEILGRTFAGVLPVKLIFTDSGTLNQTEPFAMRPISGAHAAEARWLHDVGM